MFLHTTIRADHIQTPLQATQRNAAIRELLQLVSAEISDSKIVYEAVLEREKIRVLEMIDRYRSESS